AGQLLVSRSFYEVVSCLSLDYASLFSYVGARTDKHVREHEVYSVGIGTDAARRVIETGSRRVAPRRGPRLIGELTDVRPFGVHRMAFIGAPLAFVLLVSGGVAVRAQMHHAQLVLMPAPQAVKTVTQAPARSKASPAPETGTALERAQPDPRLQAAPSAEPNKDIAAAPMRAQSAAAAAPGGVIQLAILPWGEVFVNGKSRGVSPPLRSVDVPPGTHTIQVRNTSFPTHTRRVKVRAGEPVRIRHRFR
ncbi:MAG: PEGA domain-containing protein, partial [Burkholderiales bacterium]